MLLKHDVDIVHYAYCLACNPEIIVQDNVTWLFKAAEMKLCPAIRLGKHLKK